MNGLFGRELYIRLAPDGKAFVCTTRYGKFYSKAKKFLLGEAGPAEESAPARKKRVTARLSLLPLDTNGDD